MEFEEMDLKGVFLISPEPYQDDRGLFRRLYCADEYIRHGLIPDVRQTSISENKYQYTLRGLHYQTAPYGEGKTMSILRGAIYDIVVDLKPDSPTYLKWQSFEIDEFNRKSLYIPPWCAHAFLTMAKDTWIHYTCSQPYVPEAGRGIRYNDPFFKFHWPHEPEVISDKDKGYPDFVPEKKPIVTI